MGRVEIGDRCIDVVLSLGILVDRVDSESIDATLEPESHCVVVDGIAAFLVLPVEVGLVWSVQVQVVFLRVLVPRPC